eukprot:COSAG06_NODE_11080_length_1570_cov_11.419443_2_plen_99_part_00
MAGVDIGVVACTEGPYATEVVVFVLVSEMRATVRAALWSPVIHLGDSLAVHPTLLHLDALPLVLFMLTSEASVSLQLQRLPQFRMNHNSIQIDARYHQ